MIKRFGWLIGILVLFSILPAAAQDAPEGLSIEDAQIAESVGSFGQPILELRGRLVNTGESAVTDISLIAEAFAADDSPVAEGFGAPVDACGAGLLFDFALQPGHAQTFAISLEVFDTAPIDRFEITPSGTLIDPQPPIELPDAIRPVVTDQSVAQVEWVNERILRFGVGCRTDMFSMWDWYTFNVRAVQPFPGEHPHTADVTPELAQTLQLDDPNASRLTFSPTGDRLVYQNAINTLITAGFNGEAPRTLYSFLSRRTLQEIYWLPEERFITYYFDGYGDPVYYFTADAEAHPISPALENNPPSISLPGSSWDGRRVVFSSEWEAGVFGYTLYVVTNSFEERLFEAVPPGNNYPPPLPLANPADNLIDRIYLPMDVEGEPRLMCYNRLEGELIDLAPLPFRLREDERAQWWISPDETRIALAVSAAEGGLWMIDLTALPACRTGVE